MKYILLVISAFMIYSCTVDDNVIPAPQRERNYLVYEAGSSNLSIYDANKKNWLTIDYNDSEMLTSGDSVVCVRSFFDKSYVVTQSGRLLVLNNETKQIVADANLESTFDRHSDIVFPNASSAYISSGLSGKIAVFDIANNKFVKTIEESESAFDMNYYGTNLYVCNTIANRIDIYDTRTDVKIGEKKTENAPVCIEYFDDKDYLIVACAGSGKFDKASVGAAKLSIYEREKFSNVETINIERNQLTADKQIPNGLLITDLSFAIISTNDGIFRYNLKFSNSIAIISALDYKSMLWDTYKGEGILPLENGQNRTIHLLDLKTQKIATVLEFDRNIDYIYPLND